MATEFRIDPEHYAHMVSEIVCECAATDSDPVQALEVFDAQLVKHGLLIIERKPN